MGRNQDDGNEDPPAKRRLRLPAALAVALFGTSASVAMTFAGCSGSGAPEPVDAGKSTSMTHDAGVIDGENTAADAPDGAIDAMVDAMVDAPQIADAPKPPPDAYKPPVDAYEPPVDAYMPPPDAPHT